MNVLVLLTDLFDAVGGIQTFNRAFVKALDEIASEHRWTVTVLVLNDRGNNSLITEYVSSHQTRYMGFSGSRRQFVLAALNAARKADVVIFGHVNFAPLVFAVRLVRPFAKSYLAVYGVEAWKRLPILRRVAALQMELILSISRVTASRMQEQNHMPPERFTVFPCTLDPLYGRNGITPRSREDLGLPKGRMLLSVARLDALERYYKKIDLVIEAMPWVLKEVPDAFYVVVGDGSDRARLEALARTIGVEDRVRFVGRISDELLPSYYRACDLFVLPSLEEGFGIVFLEAMYYAKPCIGAKFGGSPEVIGDCKTGFLAEPSDKDDLTRKIILLLRDAVLRHSMGHAGKQELEQRFSIDMFRMRLASILCHEDGAERARPRHGAVSRGRESICSKEITR